MRVVKYYLLIFFLIILLLPYTISVFVLKNPKEEKKQTDDFFEVLLYRTETDTVEKIDCYDYICNVLSGEMSASDESEALKAQAVACYTYLLGRINYVKENPNEDIGHKGAYVCDDSSHCMAYLEKEIAKEKWGDSYFEKYYRNISDAVGDVIGLAITYDSLPINAVFHSVSSGRTQSAQEVWGAEVPYLISVDSSFDKTADGFETETRFSKERFREIFKEELGVDLPKSVDCWIGETEKTESGLVKQITVADTVYTGTYIRKLFSLRSSCFDVKLEDSDIVFTVRGYGHGVGMSQHGAKQLAKKGYDFREILSYYYSGIEIKYQNP